MAKAKKVTKTAKTKKTTKAIRLNSNSQIIASSSLLLAGAIIVLVGMMQSDSVNTILVGFGAAFLFISAVLFGMVANTSK